MTCDNTNTTCLIKLARGDCSMVTGWVGKTLAQLWPYLLLMLGILIVGVVILVMVKGGATALCESMIKRRQDREGLLQGEELTHV